MRLCMMPVSMYVKRFLISCMSLSVSLHSSSCPVRKIWLMILSTRADMRAEVGSVSTREEASTASAIMMSAEVRLWGFGPG